MKSTVESFARSAVLRIAPSIDSQDEQRCLKLKATEWRGYEYEDEGEDIGHPRNLLEPGTDTRYQSKYEKGKPNED